MPISQDQAQALCDPTEWKTVVNSFAPKLEKLTPAVAKKQTSRIKRFLQKASTDNESKERLSVFTEAIERLQSVQPAQEETNEKLLARRQKEQAAKEKAKLEKSVRHEVREKLQKKAEEAAAKEGGATEDSDKASVSGSSPNARKSVKRTQGRIGTRKV